MRSTTTITTTTTTTTRRRRRRRSSLLHTPDDPSLCTIAVYDSSAGKGKWEMGNGK
jgi:hypothetical protein